MKLRLIEKRYRELVNDFEEMKTVGSDEMSSCMLEILKKEFIYFYNTFLYD